MYKFCNFYPELPTVTTVDTQNEPSDFKTCITAETDKKFKKILCSGWITYGYGQKSL